MAGTYKGVTAVWYCKDVSVATSGTGNAYAALTGDLHIQNLGASKTADVTVLKNSSGEGIGEGHTNHRQEATLEVIPSGANSVAALTANILPDSGKLIVLTATKDPYLAGNWISDGGDARGDISSPRSISLKMHRYSANDISADAAAI